MKNLLLSVMMLTFFACSKESEKQVISQRSISTCIFNDFMDQGELHNQTVLQVLEEYRFDTVDISGGQNLFDKINPTLGLNQTAIDLVLSNPPSEDFNAHNTTSMSSQLISYLEEVHSWIFAFGDDPFFGSNYSPSELMNFLCIVSDRVDDDTILSATEKNLLQGSIAVLYSSFKLWTPLSDGGYGGYESIRFSEFRPSSINTRKDPCKCAIGFTAWSDMWGFTISLGNPVAGAGASVGTALANLNNFKDC